MLLNRTVLTVLVPLLLFNSAMSLTRKVVYPGMASLLFAHYRVHMDPPKVPQRHRLFWAPTERPKRCWEGKACVVLRKKTRPVGLALLVSWSTMLCAQTPMLPLTYGLL